MAKFLTTVATSSEIESIITHAKRDLYLISPYLQLSDNIVERLVEASNKRRVTLHIIFKDSENIRKEEITALSGIKRLELYYCEKLHAKCYYNETNMVITSLNLYQFSERNNREMGVLIEKDKDREVFAEAEKETKSIINISKKVIVLNGKIEELKTDKGKTTLGFCIRCAKGITRNTEIPFCDTCHKSWAIFGNYSYSEKYCHSCGIKCETSMNKPKCYECWHEEIKTI